MKKLMLFTVVGVAFFASCQQETQKPEIPCEKEPPEEVIKSLIDTKWKMRVQSIRENGEWVDGWVDYELAFTSTNYTYTITLDEGNTIRETGTYTYDPPEVAITNRYMATSTGTVEKDTMKIGIWMSPDIVQNLELTKQ